MANIKNSNSKLGKQRSVECPTCHAKAGEHCVSVGLKGKVGGKLMTTSCHSPRIVAAGDTPNYQRVTKAKPARVDRHKAGKRAWKARLANQRKRDKIDQGFGPILDEYIPVVPSHRSLQELTGDVLAILLDRPYITSSHVTGQGWSVTARREGESYSVAIEQV